MNQSTYRFTLDLHSSQSQISIPVTQGDTARAFLISLSDGGLPYTIGEGCIAIIEFKRPNEDPFQEFCVIEKNAIKYDFSKNENTAAVAGVHECDITLYDATGMKLGTPRFTMVVTEKALNSDTIDLSEDGRTIIDSIMVSEIERRENEEQRQAAENQRKESFPLQKSIYGHSENSLNMIDEDGARDNSKMVTYDGDTIVIEKGGHYFPFATIYGNATDETDDVVVMVKCKDRGFDGNVQCCISNVGRPQSPLPPMHSLERVGEWLVKKFKVSDFNETQRFCVLRCDARYYSKDVTIEDAIINIGTYVKEPKGVNKTAYVNCDAGNDINSGSLAAPFKTIQRAIDSGATVIRVASGIYEESLRISRRDNISILPSEMSTYQDDEPDTPKIHITGGANKAVDNAIWIEHCENVTLEGIWFDNVKSNIAVIDKCFNLNITDCWFSNNEEAEAMGLRLYNVNGVIRNCKAFNIVMDGFNIHGYGNTQFIDCVAHDCGDDGISHHDGNTGAIIGGEYYRCGKGGVSSPTYGAYVDIINVYSHDNAYGIYADSTDNRRKCKARITGCLLMNNSNADVYANSVDIIGWKNNYETSIVTDTASFVEYEVNKNAIAENQTAIAYNRAAIEENQASIATHTEKLATIKSNVKNLEAQVYGKSKNFVCDSFEEFVAFCNATDPTLTTSDNILIIENGVPDFWFEATTDEDRLASAGTYTYNGVEYPLVGLGEDGNPVGVFHILESDFTEVKAQMEQDLAGKIDKIENTLGSEVAYIQRPNNEVQLRQVSDSPAAMSIPRRTNTGAVRVESPTEGNHAVNLKYLSDNYGTHESRIAEIEAWIGKQRQTIVESDADGKIKIPSDAKQYAQILEIHGYESAYRDEYYALIAERNFPQQIKSDAGVTLFAMPSDWWKLSNFGIQGNYIFFDEDRVYYKQVAKQEDYYYELQDGEDTITTYSDVSRIVELAEPIITDITDMITYPSAINLAGVKYITFQPHLTEEYFKQMAIDSGNNEYEFEWKMPKIKIMLEV